MQFHFGGHICFSIQPFGINSILLFCFGSWTLFIIYACLFTFGFGRTRKASITTGIVERSEPMKCETQDRLSPLTSSSIPFLTLPTNITDPHGDLEKFADVEAGDANNQVRIYSIASAAGNKTSLTFSNVFLQVNPNLSVDTNTNQLCPQNANNMGNTRRHTVGPGDVAHEQAFVNPGTNPITFKLGTEMGTNIPVNLPMLQNQPLHNFTIKDQHLLKPPQVMGQSESLSKHSIVKGCV